MGLGRSQLVHIRVAQMHTTKNMVSRVLAPCRPFLPKLMFVSKAGAYPSGDPFSWKGLPRTYTGVFVNDINYGMYYNI